MPKDSFMILQFRVFYYSYLSVIITANVLRAFICCGVQSSERKGKKNEQFRYNSANVCDHDTGIGGNLPPQKTGSRSNGIAAHFNDHHRYL